MKRLLCVAYGGGHAKILIRIQQFLERNYCDEYKIVSLGLTLGYSNFQDAGFQAKRFVDYVDPVADSRALALGKELASQMHAGNTGIDF